LTDIAGHIGLAGIPIRYRPYRRDHPHGDHCDFKDELHADDLTIQRLRNRKTAGHHVKILPIIGRV
jgi:hypothetical protein